jgi:hypothetical protein
MRVVADTTELDSLADLFNRRAEELVPNVREEGIRRAESYAQAGGRHRDQSTRRYHPTTRRRIHRVRHATEPQKARMIEHVMYHKLMDFFGSW